MAETDPATAAGESPQPEAIAEAGAETQLPPAEREIDTVSAAASGAAIGAVAGFAILPVAGGVIGSILGGLTGLSIGLASHARHQHDDEETREPA